MVSTTTGSVQGAVPRRRHPVIYPYPAAMQAALLLLLLFTLWWHRPASVEVKQAVFVLVAHTAATVVLLGLVRRRGGDPTLAPLVLTAQLLAMIGLVLRMRVDAGGAASVVIYILGVAVAVVMFVLGRGLVRAVGTSRPAEPNRGARRIPLLSPLAALLGRVLVRAFGTSRPADRNRRAGKVLFWSTCLAVVLLLLASEVRGARISLRFPGGQSVQPAELLRFCLVGFIAYRLVGAEDAARHWGPHVSARSVRSLLIFALVPAILASLLFLRQNDLGPAGLLFVGIVGVVVYMSGKLYHAWMPAVLFGVAAALAVWLRDLATVADRFALRADPFFMGCEGDGCTLRQPGKALLAYARGGLFGEGLGTGRVDSIGLERQNDYILAVLGEEFGLIGVLLVVALYVALVVQLFRYALRGPEPWVRAWAVGLSVMLSVNILLPLLSATSLTPVIGITTPLLSSGGTSMLVVAATIGLIAGTGAAGGGGERPRWYAAEVAARERRPRAIRPTRVWVLPALALAALLLACTSLVRAQVVIAQQRLDTYDPDGRIARIERATIEDRGRILAADSNAELTVVASSESDGVSRRLRRPVDSRLGAPVGTFDPTWTHASGVENRWSEMLECGPQENPGLDAVIGSRCEAADLRLTLNSAIQNSAVRALERAADQLGGTEGAVVALDPRTGAVLAVVSTGKGGPNLAVDDPSHPGSVFKLVTAAAAKPTSVADYPFEPRTTLKYEYGVLGNAGGATCTATTLVEALRYSCNTAFGELGQDIGSDAIIAMGHDFGFAKGDLPPADNPAADPPPCGDPRRSPRLGLFCDVDGMEVRASRIGGRPGERCYVELVAIGEQCVFTTPFQMAMIGAAVAADGVLHQPYLVQRAERAGKQVWPVGGEARDIPTRQVLPPATARLIQDGMVEAVEREGGTAASAALPCATVAAKTGTAEVGQGEIISENNAWMVAFAPAAKPKVAVAVYLRASSGKLLKGGSDAGPVAKEVLQTALESSGDCPPDP